MLAHFETIWVKLKGQGRGSKFEDLGKKHCSATVGVTKCC